MASKGGQKEKRTRENRSEIIVKFLRRNVSTTPPIFSMPQTLPSEEQSVISRKMVSAQGALR